MLPYNSQDLVRVHSFSQSDDQTIINLDKQKKNYVAIAVDMFLQPSLVYIRGRELGLFAEESLHTVPSVDHEGYIQLPPIADVKKIQVWDWQHKGNVTAWIGEHIWMAASAYGPIARGIQIHHINFHKLDNDPKNLWPCTATHHLEAQNSLQGIMIDLLESRQVKFDRDTGMYLVQGQLASLIYTK